MRKFDVEELTPIGRRPVLTEIIAGQLIHLIMEGQYTSGDRLPTELELAQRFHTGRGTVREALKALAVVGLIRVERGRGTFIADRSDFLVRPISLGLRSGSDLESLIDARRGIECELAGLAAERAQLAEVHSIESALARLTKCTLIKAFDIPLYLESDVEFHVAIAKAAHSSLLGQFLTLLRNLLEEWFLVTLSETRLATQGLEHHHLVFEAIRDKKPEAARDLMRKLVAFGAECLRMAKQDHAGRQFTTGVQRHDTARTF
jgi:GntR family transcriptional repressor for pyruvate dehydrogenase complex